MKGANRGRWRQP